MTHTKLINENKVKPRTKFQVKIEVDCYEDALACAKALHKMANTDELDDCSCWAVELADIFEGK